MEDIMKATPSTSLALLETPTSNIQNLDKYTAGELIARRKSLLSELVATLGSLKRNILDAGRILTELRGVTPYGEWETVLKGICADFDISRSSAHDYMQAHEKVNSLPVEVVAAAHEAKLNLSSKSKLDAVVQAVIQHPMPSRRGSKKSNVKNIDWRTLSTPTCRIKNWNS
jgi:hypothetical protein